MNPGFYWLRYGISIDGIYRNETRNIPLNQAQIDGYNFQVGKVFGEILKRKTGQIIVEGIHSMGWPIVVLPSWVKCKNGTEGRPEMVEGHDFNVAVLFTPDPSCFVDSKTKDFKPGGTPAESLFHELVHAFRHVTETASKRPGPYKGAQKNPFVPSALKKNYPEFDEEEEFFAVLITNIFSSETGRPLRKDHNDLEALPPELSTNKGFLAVEEYARLIRQFCGEHRSVSQQIRDVPSQFKSDQGSYRAGGPTPRERGLRNILAGRYFSNSSSCILSLSPASPCKTAPSPVGWSKNTPWARWFD